MPAVPVAQPAPPPVPKPIEAEPAAPAPAVSKKGQVLTVNRKFRFIVINVGMKDQVKMGAQYLVLHDGKEVGRVQVEKLFDNFAAANIVDESEKTPITEGDAVQSA